VAPSQRTSFFQSVNGWLDQRRPWQYALIRACGAAAAATVTLLVIQWLLRGHLNLSAVPGTAAGSMIGCFTVAFGYRLTRPPKH
jgi:predicted lysophospholipase L1 biosynthesis ABC-type transport system permease subunit